MKKLFLLVFVLAPVMFFCVGAFAASNSEVKQLKESNEQLQEKINQLETKLHEHVDPATTSADGTENEVSQKKHEMQIERQPAFLL